jgi:hypothetical protein
MLPKKIIERKVNTLQKKVEEKKTPFEPILNKKITKNFKLESKKSTLEKNTLEITQLERDMKSIIITKLSNTITAKVLTDIFSKCGPIENIQFKWIDMARGIHTKRVDIEFKTNEARENALKMDQMLLKGYPITIKHKAKYIAFVSGLPEKISPYLESFFSECGRCKVYREKPGTAYVQFRSIISLDQAISFSDTKIFENTIKVINISLFGAIPEMGSKKIAPVPEVEEIPKSIPKKKVESEEEESSSEEESSEEESSDEESSEEEIPKSIPKKKVSKVESSSEEEESSSGESSSEEEIPKSTKKKVVSKVESSSEEEESSSEEEESSSEEEESSSDEESSEEEIPKSTKKRTLGGAEEPKTKIQKTNNGPKQQDELKKKELELKKKELELKKKELELKMKEMKIKENELKKKEEDLKIKEKKLEK